MEFTRTARGAIMEFTTTARGYVGKVTQKCRQNESRQNEM